MEAYMDRDLAPEQRAQDLLSKLSLPEKMAQIRGVFAMGYPGDDSPEWIRGRGIGQISALRLQMMPTFLEDAMDWLHTMQDRQDAGKELPEA